MKHLHEQLTDEAKEELVRTGVIELVSVIAHAGPDPERPDDRLTMKIIVEVSDVFAPGRPGTDQIRSWIREICKDAGKDFSMGMQDSLHVALNRNRKALDQLREGKIGGEPVAYLSDPQAMAIMRPIFQSLIPDVTVWCLAWVVWMEDDGELVVDYENCFMEPNSCIAVRTIFDGRIYAEDRDHATQERVMARMEKIRQVMERVPGVGK